MVCVRQLDLPLILPVYMGWGVGPPKVARPVMALKFAAFLLDSKLFFHVVKENHSLDSVVLLLSW